MRDVVTARRGERTKANLTQRVEVRGKVCRVIVEARDLDRDQRAALVHGVVAAARVMLGLMTARGSRRRRAATA